jgi:two-component system nitrate/nitrite response regulator NarL
MPSIGALRSSTPVDAKPVLLFLICRVRLYHDSLLKLLNRQAGVTCLGSMDFSDDLVHALETVGPDAVLLETGSPEALALASSLVKARPRTRILGFGVDDVPVQVIACAEAGLCGYVPNSASIADLAQAARRVALGDMVCSAGIGDKLFDHLRRVALNEFAAPAQTMLTARQRQILELIREGLSNKEIAQRLSLGTSTVKNHVHGLLSRLQVGRRSEAAAGVHHAARSISARRHAPERRL